MTDPDLWPDDDLRKSKEIADLVAAENIMTEAYFRVIPERETIRRRLTELWKYEKSLWAEGDAKSNWHYPYHEG